MTIRIQPSVRTPINSAQIAALITESILTPTNDDAPASKDARPHGSWVSWSRSLAKPADRVN